MGDGDEICPKCGGRADDHYTDWSSGHAVVGSYRDAPNGRICYDAVQARAEAFEEAAKIAEASVEGYVGRYGANETEHVQIEQVHEVARRLRAASKQPHESA